MAPANDAFPVVRFSTEGIPEPEQPTALRDAYARKMLRFDYERLPDRPLKLTFAARALPGLAITSGLTSGFRGRRTSSLRGDADDTLFFGTTLCGKTEVRQRGRNLVMGRGDAALFSNADLVEARTSGTIAFAGVHLAHAMLAPLVLGLNDVVMHPVAGGIGTLKLFTHYARSLLEDDTVLSPQLAQLAATHLCDLVAVALGATREATAVAEGRGLRAARLRAVQADIVSNLDRTDITVKAMSQRHRLSVRYIQRLFEDEGTTFSQFALQRRLAHAHRMLTNPSRQEWTIADIAAACGFTDHAHFSRRFRARYGASPSEVRNQSG